MDFENQPLTTDQAPLAKPVEAARSTHTQGPWEVRYRFCVYATGTSNDICRTNMYEGGNGEADACLIAAAPELMSALVALLRETNSIEVLGEWEVMDINFKSRKTVRAKVDGVIAQARAAIAKARGQ
jgi:hypothetical protein